MKRYVSNPTVQAALAVWLVFLALTATARFDLALFTDGWPMSLTMVFGSLIAGQFLLYDYWKQVFRVSTNDITLVLDVFADRMSFYQ